MQLVAGAMPCKLRQCDCHAAMHGADRFSLAHLLRSGKNLSVLISALRLVLYGIIEVEQNLTRLITLNGWRGCVLLDEANRIVSALGWLCRNREMDFCVYLTGTAQLKLQQQYRSLIDVSYGSPIVFYPSSA